MTVRTVRRKLAFPFFVAAEFAYSTSQVLDMVHGAIRGRA